VAFNGHWKQSLSELSGGQKSLLALSLILALLRYKPAPLYILDEIDAALDLSHTQNIGTMIRKYFPQSQFIIVSLKEDLFTNANVIYRVEFNEGRSQVRMLKKEKGQQNNGPKSKKYAAEDSDEEESEEMINTRAKKRDAVLAAHKKVIDEDEEMQEDSS